MVLLWRWQEHPAFVPEEIPMRNRSPIVVLGNGISDAHASRSFVIFNVCDRCAKSGVIQERARAADGELIPVALPSRSFIDVMQEQHRRAGVRTYALQDQKQLSHLSIIRLVTGVGSAQGVDNNESCPLCTCRQPIGVPAIQQIKRNTQHGQKLKMLSHDFSLCHGEMTSNRMQPSPQNDFWVL